MKNTTLITIVILSLAAIFAVIGIVNYYSNKDSGSSGPNVYSQSALTVEENATFDFGEVSMANGNVSYKVKLANNGSEPTIINKVYTSCMCTTAMIDIKGEKSGPFGMPGHTIASSKSYLEVPAAETAEVEVIFDPTAHGPSGVGLAQRSVFIETNSTNSPMVELQFKAVVVK